MVRLGFFISPLTPNAVSKPANAKNKIRVVLPKVEIAGKCSQCRFS